MKLKGLPYYDITDEGGVLKVWSLQCKRNIVRTNNPNPGYRLNVDGKLRFFSDGHLRFLMNHPDVHASTITPRSNHICFNDDGTVRNYHPDSRSRSYAEFKGLDDALNTILMLIAAEEGDRLPLEQFIAESREKACVIVARMMRTTTKRVTFFLEEGESLFFKQVKTARVQNIQPLFSWLCKCIKTVMLTSKKFRSIDITNLDRTRIRKLQSEMDNCYTN